MEFIDALQENATKLAKYAEKLLNRIDNLKKNGFSAEASTQELVKVCEEIGRLNDTIRGELDKKGI